MLTGRAWSLICAWSPVQLSRCGSAGRPNAFSITEQVAGKVSYRRGSSKSRPTAVHGLSPFYGLLTTLTDLTDIADYWYIAEDKILRDEAIGRQVNIIVHSLDEVNHALSRGEYFWVDIARDGISLYDLPGSALAASTPLTSADAYEMASGYFRDQLKSLEQWIELAEYSVLRTEKDADWSRKAAFNLHQAIETAYASLLLVRTLYFPRSHNIKFLRSLAEDSEPRLIDAWPRASRPDRRRFELVKRAYVEARYSASYEISVEDLEAITTSVRRLRDIVDEVCRERIESLREAAGL